MSSLNRALTWLHRRQVRGRHRLHALVANAVATPPLVCADTRYGAKLLLNPYEYVDSLILRYGFYESEVFEALRPHLSAGGVFWDIGSNTGLHGVCAKVRFSELEVVCFEPVPLLANRIMENARLNSVSVTVFASALGSASGSAWVTVTPGNLGMSHIADQRAGSGPSLLTAIQSADSLIASGRIPAPTIVKIDTEGSEQAIFSGMTTGLKSVRAIAFEAGSDVLESPDHPIRRLLDPLGFRYRLLVREEPTAHNLENFIAERL